jgi:3,5-dihydroxyphenylacetyl-CoA synthase
MTTEGTSSPAILAIGTATPERRYTQQQLYDVLRERVPFYRSDTVRRIFLDSGIAYRHFFFDLETLDLEESRDGLHDRFRRGSLTIGAEAARRCLHAGGINPSEIDFVAAVSCTGYLCPGLSALMVRELGLRTDVQRADLLGMGCSGAMPGLQRACDFVSAHPGSKALLLTVEICSACYYLDDSLETVVGNTICADGAAAAVIGMSADAALPKITGFRSLLEPAFMDAVGFRQVDGRLRIVLSKELRTIAGAPAERLISSLLSDHGLRRDAVTHWILHPGGRKVIDTVRETLGLDADQVRHSTCILKNFGNMSSPTVLFVLDEVLRTAAPGAGDHGVMLAMGPGLALETALVRW